ncbi:scoloptoxin SSD14-like isoform X2 [Venturia canescens]|uniref:scoloptoxin SSD14-like isoform X2 n=1 Tax=Venturia canescens TaxID=32260 RepID=UPI001C9CD09A|nr:scoloptoxin SSD14-like isoform X2 [Venturia canescens]
MASKKKQTSSQRVAEDKNVVRRRKTTTLLETRTNDSNTDDLVEISREQQRSDPSLVHLKSRDTNSAGSSKNTNPESRYGTPRQLITLGLLITGIVMIVILGAFVNRPIRRSRDSAHSKNNDGALVPPDPEIPQPPSWSKLRKFKRGAVCTDGAQCAEIGKSMLDRNGSAVDAALAAMICNGLINMQAMGIGGGFLMTLYERSTRQKYFLNAREAAPILSRHDMYENQSAMASRIGGSAISVPGEIAGYWEAHRKFGKLPWAELFHPSIKLCNEGYNVTRAQHDALLVYPPNIHGDPTLREMFVADAETGEFVRPGTLIRPKKLCETLRLIADHGASVLYNGTLGEQLIEDLKKRGSILTMNDLKNYRALWSKPVRTKLSGGLELISSGLPSSGPLLVFVINVLENYHFNSESLANLDDAITTYHRIIETWKYAYAMRGQLGDGDFSDMAEMTEKLISKTYAQNVKKKIRDDETRNEPKYYGATKFASDDHGTAHISVLAPNGDAVSVTSSINFYFGSGVVSESTGIVMNSGMDDFGTTSSVNYFGLPAGEKNRIEPGKKSLSSMVPSIVIQDDGNVRMIVGAAGGTKMLTSVSYVIARHLWMNNSIKEAVDAARIHHQLFPMEISYEFGLTRPLLEGLTRLGHRISRYRDRGSVVCALARINDTIYANVDYRKSGEVYGID